MYETAIIAQPITRGRQPMSMDGFLPILSEMKPVIRPANRAAKAAKAYNEKEKFDTHTHSDTHTHPCTHTYLLTPKYENSSSLSVKFA